MSRKRPKQRAAVGRLGKFLTRRSRGRCELCSDRDSVRPFELVPFPPEPDPDRTLMTCARCRHWLERGSVDAIQARFLETAMWSDLVAVRMAAVRLVVQIDDPTNPWLADTIEATGIDPTTGEPQAP